MNSPTVAHADMLNKEISAAAPQKVRCVPPSLREIPRDKIFMLRPFFTGSGSFKNDRATTSIAYCSSSFA
jgi:hypothetical protein